MKFDKRKTLLFTVVFSVLISLLIILFSFSPSFQSPLDLEQPIKKAIDYLALTDEPHALLWLDVIYRRFGIQEFADSSQHYDKILNQLPVDQLQLRAFRRIIDYNNSIQKRDLDSFVGIDSIVVPALYCDRFGLTTDYFALLEENVNYGEYELTHVLLAVVWIKENGFKFPLSDDFLMDLYSANAELIDNDYVVEDLELEAAVFLYLAGQGNLVDPLFIERVTVAQNEDGGWSISGNSQDNSDWHPTILGLLLLLHANSQSESYPTILSQPTS